MGVLWGQQRRGREKDLSYVAVFLCQEHQLRGICLRSLVIVDSMLEAIVLWSVTPTKGPHTHTQTCVHGSNQLKCALAVFLAFFTSTKSGLMCCTSADVSVPSFRTCACVLVPRVCVPLACPLWMMALLKCCEEKHWFATPLIHCWCERNLHSRQTQGRSGLSLAGWLDTSSLSSGIRRFGSSHSALAHNLQAGFAEEKKKSKSLEQIRMLCLVAMQCG